MSDTSSEATRTAQETGQETPAVDPIAAGIAQLRGRSQEQGAGDVAKAESARPATTPDATSEDRAQEHPAPKADAKEPKVAPTGKLTKEQVEELLKSKEAQAILYRQAQSMKDKELLQERLKAQQEAEQRKIEEMDDEEYGRHLRTRQQEQQSFQQQVGPVLYQMLTKQKEAALARISDPEARAKIEAANAQGKYQTFEDFLDACIDAESDVRGAKRAAKREKEIREAALKEQQAELSDVTYPQLGRGLPTARANDLHGLDAIKAGLNQRTRAKQS